MILTNFQSCASQKPTLGNSVHYIAHTFSFLARGKDTDGAFSLIHCYFRKGFSPPPHYHTLEEESFFILAGEIDFHVGDTKVKVSAGELITLPRNVPHYFNLITDTAKALMFITPAGFEVFFEEFGQPAKTLDLPPMPATNSRHEMFEAMHTRMVELGNVFMPEV